MQYTRAFLIKLAVTVGVLFIVLGLFFDVSFTDILIIGIVLTILAFVGDLTVLPKVGNMIAATGDLILAFLVVWVLGSNLFDADTSLLSTSLLSSLFIGAGELYYHRYLRDHVFENVDFPNNNSRVHHELQTEFAEDFDKDIQSRKKDENQ